MDEKLYSTQTNYDDRCLELLSQPREGVICTVGPNSTPHSVPAWYLFESDKFYISTHSRSRRAKNVIENPVGRVLVVYSGGWISGAGAARLIDGDGFEELQDRVLERYLTEEGQKHFKSAGAFPDDCVLEISAEKKMTWSKLSIASNIQKSGYTLEESAKWFIPIKH